MDWLIPIKKELCIFLIMLLLICLVLNIGYNFYWKIFLISYLLLREIYQKASY